MEYLSIWDFILAPVYLIVLTYIAKKQRDKKYPVGHPLRNYYLKGLNVKFIGAIFIALVYEFYYHGGDTFNYFYHSQVINSAFGDSFSTWLNLILRRSPDTDPSMYNYVSQMYWYRDPSTYTVSALGAIVGLFCGTTYIPIALIFAFASYSGIWAMFQTFARLYPKMHKPLAYAFLFIPSTFVWGSALFKDTVCMFGLGWLTYCTFRIFVDRDLSFKNFFLLALGFYLVATIKIYIIMAYLPALGFWLLMNYSKKIRIAGLRWILNLGFVAIIAFAFIYAAQQFAAELNEYSLENIAKKAQKTQLWITYVSETTEGSAYDIGKLDGTLPNMLSKFPQAVNVTLYRPYIWESKKPIVLLSALEALAFLILTLVIFFRMGIIKVFRKIFADPNLTFFLIFTLIFAFAVGISTGNFGSLSRYKIPCMPFFGSLLLILYYQTKPASVFTKTPTHARKPARHLT
ncbi:MAG: hypothetical protein J7502_04800 [Flavisolibacter sp.]|nr:hypothetical protein [Flavisolibacter sp.]